MQILQGSLVDNFKNRIFNIERYEGYIMVLLPVVSFYKDAGVVTVKNQLKTFKSIGSIEHDYMGLVNNSYLDFSEDYTLEKKVLPDGSYTVVRSFCIFVHENSNLEIGYDSEDEYYHILNAEYSTHIKMYKIAIPTTEVREYLIDSLTNFVYENLRYAITLSSVGLGGGSTYDSGENRITLPAFTDFISFGFACPFTSAEINTMDIKVQLYMSSTVEKILSPTDRIDIVSLYGNGNENLACDIDYGTVTSEYQVFEKVIAMSNHNEEGRIDFKLTHTYNSSVSFLIKEISFDLLAS